MSHAHTPTTPRPPRLWTLRSAASAAAVAAVSMCVACAPTTSTTPTAPVPISSGANAVPADAQQVCTRFATTALSIDTAHDAGPSQARHRAAVQFGTASLAEQSAGEGRDPEWTLLAQHHAQVQVSASPVGDDPAPPQGGDVGTGVVLSRVAVGSDNWRQELPGIVAYCSVSRDPSGRWQVSGFSFSDAGNGTGGE